MSCEFEAEVTAAGPPLHSYLFIIYLFISTVVFHLNSPPRGIFTDQHNRELKQRRRHKTEWD